MSSVQIERTGDYMDASMTRRPLFSAVRWGAVLAGVTVGVSVQLVLTLLGIATGLSGASIAQGEQIGFGPLLWAGISMLAAAFIGGYVASRMSGLKRKADGVFHGMVSWAVTTLLFATLATSAGGVLLSGILGGMSSAGMMVASQSGDVDGRLAGLLRRQVGGNVTPETLSALQQNLQQGRRDEALRQLTGNMNVDPVRAESIVDQALILAGKPGQASPQARARADRALGAASTAAWTVFGAVTLSLLMGILGGALASIAARRPTWTDTDPVARGLVSNSTPRGS